MTNTRDRDPSNPPEGAALQEELYALEMYRTETGNSEFVYDEELDVFRFPEDSRFAFCDEFADWRLLRERGYVVF
jgi:hypothetical protein